MGGQQSEPKGQQITMRADAAMVRELKELAELLSTEFVKATAADALRAVFTVGAPILRERLAKDGAASVRPATTPASSAPAVRKRKPTQ
jgi:hypothetical protein